MSDGRPLPRIAELLMSHLQGTPAEKLAWLQVERAAGKLDGDDPDEIAEAEALLRMLARLSDSKAQKHLDELLDEGLKGTFPASIRCRWAASPARSLDGEPCRIRCLTQPPMLRGSVTTL